MLPPDEEALVDDVQPPVDLIIVDNERLDVLLPLKLVDPNQSAAQVGVAAADRARVRFADGSLQLVEREPFLQLLYVSREDRVQDPLVHFQLRVFEALRKTLKERE